MKKIILGLFLILGAISFAAPKNLDVNKMKKAGYEIVAEDGDFPVFAKVTQTHGITLGITVAFYRDGRSPKELDVSLRETVPETKEFLSSRENKRAYISKYKDNKYNGFDYSFAAKKSKLKDTVVAGICSADKELKNAELDKIIDRTLNEVESFLK